MLLSTSDATQHLSGGGLASSAKRFARRHKKKLGLAAALALGARGVRARRRRVVDVGAPIGADWIDVASTPGHRRGDTGISIMK